MNKFDSTTVTEFSGLPGANTTAVTLRDRLAMSALQGLVAKGMEVNANRTMTQEQRDLEMASRAYGLADAMLAFKSGVKKP